MINPNLQLITSQFYTSILILNWLDSVFAGTVPVVDSCMVGSDLKEIVLRGGYPESVLRPTHRRRAAWARQYLNALLQRDVRDIASVGNLDLFPRLVRVLAEMSGQMCNYSQLGGQLGLDHKTTARYVGILEQMFLLTRVEAWSRSRLGGLVKTPKLHFCKINFQTNICQRQGLREFRLFLLLQ
jgi:predicted AAA+ superfamily ATPase